MFENEVSIEERKAERVRDWLRFDECLDPAFPDANMNRYVSQYIQSFFLHKSFWFGLSVIVIEGILINISSWLITMSLYLWSVKEFVGVFKTMTVEWLVCDRAGIQTQEVNLPY